MPQCVLLAAQETAATHVRRKGLLEPTTSRWDSEAARSSLLLTRPVPRAGQVPEATCQALREQRAEAAQRWATAAKAARAGDAVVAAPVAAGGIEEALLLCDTFGGWAEDEEARRMPHRPPPPHRPTAPLPHCPTAPRLPRRVTGGWAGGTRREAC